MWTHVPTREGQLDCPGHVGAYQAQAHPLPAGRTTGSLPGDVPTDLGPLDSENPVVQCVVQMFTECLLRASPVLGTIPVPPLGRRSEK